MITSVDPGTSVEKNRVVFSKGEVTVALKHNCRTYRGALFLAILCEDVHSRNDCFLEEKLKINWLEPSEEDPLVYNKGTFDEQNSPKCIMDRLSVDREAEQVYSKKKRRTALKVHLTPNFFFSLKRIHLLFKLIRRKNF